MLLLSISAVLVYFFYMFSQPEIDLLSIHVINPYYHFISDFPVWVYLIFCFTALSILFVFIFITLSLYYNYTKKRTEYLKSKYDKIFASLLSSYFLSEEYVSHEDKILFCSKIKPLVKNEIQKITFLDTYLKMQEILAVNLSDDFKLIISELKLQNKIESLLFHEDFDKRILAVKVLSYLRNKTHYNQFVKYENSKNAALRTEAFAAVIRLMETGDHLTKFIGEKYSLSMLDFNIIVNAVLKNHKMNIDYRALLNSKHTRKTMIGLLLAKFRFRKSNKNISLILNHLDHKDFYLRQLVWGTILELVPKEETIDIILFEFESQPDEVKSIIIKNIKDTVPKELLEFFKSIINNQNLLIKIEILKMLYANDFAAFTGFENSEDIEIKMAYKEISNFYLSI